MSQLPRWWGVVPAAVVAALLGVRAVVVEVPEDRLREAPAEAADPPGTRAVAGSLAVTRGGPVIVGFTSPTPARLVVGTQEVRGQGVVKQRILLPPGPVAIRFAATADARLVWSPVGRRGDPEYVPASSLSPDAPEAATFDAPGRALADGVIALSILAIVVATCLVAARRRLARVDRSTWIGFGAVLLGGLIVRLIDLDGFGQTWDEDVNWAAGRNYVTNVLGLDGSRDAWSWNYEHPPVMKYVAGIGAQLADGFGPARALSALCMAIGCALLVPIGRRLVSLRVGVIAGAIATLLPPLVAHGQIVGHEAPTVLWWSLATLLALGVHDGLTPASSPWTLRWRVVAVGVVVGLAVASRFVNGLLGPLCVLIVVIMAPPDHRRSTALAIPLMIAGTVVAFVVVWPRLWTFDMFTALDVSLDKLSKPHAPEPFLGTVTNKPPAYYFLVYLAATLPVGILAFVVAGAGRLVVRRDRGAAVVASWFLIPLAIAFSPVRQDGVRYVMPCVTALAMIAAIGVDALVARIRWRHAFVSAAAAIVVYLGVTLVRVHPYYLDYFGEHVGGAAGVARRQWFETAWWGEGLDRAVGYVNANARPGARVFRDCIEPVHLAWFRSDLWPTMARSPTEADWIVVYAPSRTRCNVPADARRVFDVMHGDLSLATVFQR